LRRRVIRFRVPSRMKSRDLPNGKQNTNVVPNCLATKTPKIDRIDFPMETASSDVARAFIDRASAFLSTDYLPKIERCLEQLSDDQIWFRPNEASNSIGNLVLHLCGNARQWIVAGVGDNLDQRDRDSEFNQREVIRRANLLERLRSTISEVNEVLVKLDPDVLLESRTIQGKNVDVLEAVFHVTEHFSMHTGQIILLTKVMLSTDLRFYDFETGMPVKRWSSDTPGSS
jgi:uncharacterized damage-inducible protein DinB